MITAARWLDPMQLPDRAARVTLVRRAHADIGIEEQTRNRSGYIDEVVSQSGSPLGSAWCACIVRRWCVDAGLDYPPTSAGAVRVWASWARTRGTWRETGSYTPLPGDLVCYDFNNDKREDHIGVIARMHRSGPRAIEGNTSWGGSSREGVAVVMKPISLARVAGFIVPVLP